MESKYLKKLDFKRWQNCQTSAYHGWRAMKSKNDEDPFLEFLSEEGKIIGKAAHRLFNGLQEVVEKDPLRANELTAKALKEPTVSLSEGCVIHGNFLIRPDFLIKRDQTIYIVEVKSKVADMAAHRDCRMLLNYYGEIRAAWREIVFDLAFQVEVLRRAFSNLEVVPYLLLPEGSTAAKVDEVDAVRRQEFSPAETELLLKERRAESCLKFFSAQIALEKISNAVAMSMDAMEQTWLTGKLPIPVLQYGCRNCEFRLKDGKESSDGFHACWGDLAQPEPSLFELNQLYSLKVGGAGNKLLANEKISAGKTSLYDIAELELHGEHANRQRIQLRHQRENREWIDPRLAEAINYLEWPIAFLDFETTMSGMPWYERLKPYEVLPFEFSCHILHQDGRMQHIHWLNQEDRVPTLPFIHALKSALEIIGSILVYTDYEQRVLTDSKNLLLRMKPDHPEEIGWIDDLLNSGRIVDQHDWVQRHYFHPTMSGRTSIKKVLPSIWLSNPSLHCHEHFRQYYQKEEDTILNPYETLPTEVIDGVIYSVKEGCGAMAAYRDMIRGVGSQDPSTKAALASMLERYVTLDTASQWMLLEHWRLRLKEPTSRKILSR